jgi:hypothetical protein
VLAVVLGNPKPGSEKKTNNSSASGSSKAGSSTGKRKRTAADSSSSGGGSSSSSSRSKSSTTAAAGADTDDDADAADNSANGDDSDDEQYNEELKAILNYDADVGVPTKATLVVTPASLMGQVSSAVLRLPKLRYAYVVHSTTAAVILHLRMHYQQYRC